MEGGTDKHVEEGRGPHRGTDHFALAAVWRLSCSADY
jgi:hypothetical protein